jgi:hypothetical protein
LRSFAVIALQRIPQDPDLGLQSPEILWLQAGGIIDAGWDRERLRSESPSCLRKAHPYLAFIGGVPATLEVTERYSA